MYTDLSLSVMETLLAGEISKKNSDVEGVCEKVITNPSRRPNNLSDGVASITVNGFLSSGLEMGIVLLSGVGDGAGVGVGGVMVVSFEPEGIRMTRRTIKINSVKKIIISFLLNIFPMSL